MEMGARLVLNTDTHGPHDLITKEYAMSVIRGAGLNEEQANAVFLNSEQLAERIA
jgi:histidinol phosphatase-like PHP family hydrolase